MVNNFLLEAPPVRAVSGGGGEAYSFAAFLSHLTLTTHPSKIGGSLKPSDQIMVNIDKKRRYSKSPCNHSTRVSVAFLPFLT